MVRSYRRKSSLVSPSGSVNTDLSLDQVISEDRLNAWFKVVSDSRSVIDRLKDEGVYEEYKAWSAKNPQRFEPGWRRRFALLRGRKQFEEWRR